MPLHKTEIIDNSDCYLMHAPARTAFKRPGRVLAAEGIVLEKSRAGIRSVTVAVFAILLPVFVILGLQKSARSNSGMLPEGWHAMIGNDQHSYMNMGRKMWLSDYSRVFPRHRTPGFPWLLSQFIGETDLRTPEAGDEHPYRVTEAYFTRMKVLMVLLSALSLVAVYLVCRRWLPALESHLLTWGYAFYLAIFKAPFVQPEAIFYPLFFICLVILWGQLRKPTWWNAALAGGLLALVFILKSTVLPLVMLFLVCVALKIFVKTITSIRSGEFPRDLREMAEETAKTALIVGIFVVLLSPYFANSWKMYGNPLWDTHSRHYMWMDTAEEKMFWRNAGLGEDDFELPAGKELPTSAGYFQKHDLSILRERPKEGYQSLKRAIKKEYHGAYILIWKVGLFSLLANRPGVLEGCPAGLAPALARGPVICGIPVGIRLPLFLVPRYRDRSTSAAGFVSAGSVCGHGFLPALCRRDHDSQVEPQYQHPVDCQRRGDRLSPDQPDSPADEGFVGDPGRRLMGASGE